MKFKEDKTFAENAPAPLESGLQETLHAKAIENLKDYVRKARETAPDLMLAKLDISSYANEVMKIKKGDPIRKKGSIELLQEDSLVV